MDCGAIQEIRNHRAVNGRGQGPEHLAVWPVIAQKSRVGDRGARYLHHKAGRERGRRDLEDRRGGGGRDNLPPENVGRRGPGPAQPQPQHTDPARHDQAAQRFGRTFKNVPGPLLSRTSGRIANGALAGVFIAGVIERETARLR